jgi:hypothetical protein
VHEERERALRDAPRWEPVDEQEAAHWISDDDNLSGVLVNRGHATALVTKVVLDLPNGGGFDGSFGREPVGHIGGGQTRLDIRPGFAMRVTFHSSAGSLGQGMTGDIRPRVIIHCSSDEIGWEGTPTVELLRKRRTVTGGSGWLARAVD